MPLEIREIGIRMRVGEPEVVAPRPSAKERYDERARAMIIEDCVRRVMALLKAEQER
jgi:Family of unknown function (DUF5908)